MQNGILWVNEVGVLRIRYKFEMPWTAQLCEAKMLKAMRAGSSP